MSPRGAASYKKKDGTIAISADEKSVSWSPAVAGAGNMITIPVVNITSTQ
jgi:transcription initiation factor TFIIH subunit 1